jgi:hypothetical protein
MTRKRDSATQRNWKELLPLIQEVIRQQVLEAGMDAQFVRRPPEVSSCACMLPVLTASFDVLLGAKQVHAFPCVHPEQWKAPSLHALRARVTGTVTTRDSVESSSIDADSASIALYFAANRTTAVARGKLQQTSASRAKGPCT